MHTPPHVDTKYIVFESALLLLFARCFTCKSSRASLKKLIIGTFVRITQICSSCGSTFMWNSQPFLQERPAGNTLLAAAILFSGLPPTKALRILSFLKCSAISARTFFRIQSSHLHPVISWAWRTQQRQLIGEIKAKQRTVLVSGDGRADSPGHSAKFGTYTLLDVEENVVLDFQLVQVRICWTCSASKSFCV